MILDQLDRTLDRALVPRDHDLRRIIVIGDGTDFALGRRIGQRLRLFHIRAQQSRHRSDSHRHSRLHGLTAQLQQPRRGRQIKSTGGTESRVFAETVTGHELRLVRQPDPAFLFQHAQRCNCIGHDRGLGIFRKSQLIFRAFGHQAEKLLPQRIVDFFENLPGNHAGIGQRLAHADRLATLPRKNECAHLCSPIVSQPRLETGAPVRKPVKRVDSKSIESQPLPTDGRDAKRS